MNYYTGVGSRKTPPNILKVMGVFAYHMALKGWMLRTGNATGADAAFLEGARREGGNKAFVFHPHHATDEARKYLNDVLDPQHLDALARNGWTNLHARNVMQVLGHDLQHHSSFVVCWTFEGRMVGGTSTAIKIAEMNGIRVRNLGIPDHLRLAVEWIGRQKGVQ